jgi:DNA-directed RNA polymerase subunit K/omega
VYNLNGIDSKFRLAIMVARRAKQLIGGAKKKVDVRAENVLTVAMEEFRQGKIDFDMLNQDPSLLLEENGQPESDLEMEDGVQAEDEADPELEGNQAQGEL